MNISTSLEHAIRVCGATPAESAEMLKAAGFQGVDITLTHEMMNPPAFLAPEWRVNVLSRATAAKEAGLDIVQCHLPYLSNHMPLPETDRYAAYERFMLPLYEHAIDVCGEIGCPIAVSHPYFDINDAEGTCEGNLRLIEKLLPMLEKAGAKLAIENVWGPDYTWTNMSSADEILRVINAADDPRVGACIDTGHANIFRLDICEMARKYGSKLFALHVHGNAGKDEHVIPYTMSDWCEKMDFRGFTKALNEIGFDGYYNLELSPGPLPHSAMQPYLNLAGAVARALADL